MEPKFNTSFIPKKSLQDTVVADMPRMAVGRRENPSGPIYAFSLVILLLVVGASVGLFVYTSLLEKTVEKKFVDVEGVRAQLKNDIVTNLITMDERITTVKTFVENHSALSVFLPFLESITLKQGVRYQSVSYNGGATTEKETTRPFIEVTGTATALETVALQVSEYKKSPKVVSVDLSGVNRNDSTGEVIFSAKIFVFPETFTLSKMSESVLNASSSTSFLNKKNTLVATTTASSTSSAMSTSTNTSASTTKKKL